MQRDQTAWCNTLASVAYMLEESNLEATDAGLKAG
jgi:hypothetical protein